jgi:hypothetical protein
VQQKDNENLRKVLNKYGASVVAEMKTRLQNQGKVASRKLLKSLKYDLSETLEDIELNFYAEDYYIFVDKGVNGYQSRVGSPYSFKPKNGQGTGKSKLIPALKKWCRTKGIPEGAAFAIRRNIWKFGIKPTQFWSISTKRREKQLFKDIEKAQQADLQAQLDKIAKEK